MPVRSRDDRFPRSECNCKCAGNDLRFLAIGSDIDVCRAHVLDQFFGTHKAVIEDHVWRNAKFVGCACKLSLYFSPSRRLICGCVAPETMYITFFMLFENSRKGADHVFDFPLLGDSKPNVRSTGFPGVPNKILEIVRVGEWKIGNSVRNHVDFAGRHAVYIAQETGGMLAHHDQTIREMCNLVENRTLVRIRITQNRMKCCHERHFQLAEQRQDVTTSDSSENAVFVLHADQIVSIEIEKLGGPLVRCFIFLRKLPVVHAPDSCRNNQDR